MIVCDRCGSPAKDKLQKGASSGNAELAQSAFV